MAFLTSTKLVVGRGELYFGRFLEGTRTSEGERYLGNTPGFSVARNAQEVQRVTSYSGQQITLDTHIIREEVSASITTDNIDVENLGLWLGGPIDSDGQEAAGMISETFRVKRGRHYQLGTTAEIAGVRHVEPDITFSLNGSPIDEPDANFVLNLTEGRFYVLPEAADVPDGSQLDVEFQWRASSKSELVSTGSTEMVGCLRFISMNPVGDRTNYFFPYVRIKPVGQVDMKGDQWQQMLFSADIRRLSPAAEYFYALKIAGAEYTQDEQAIIDLGPMPLDAFPATEDLLDQIINTFIPAGDYGAPIDHP